MTATENDCLLALSIAKLLDVELLPWQEAVLRSMLAAHREPPASVRGPRGECGAVYDNSDPANVIRCTRPCGHLGTVHRANGGFPWPVT